MMFPLRDNLRSRRFPIVNYLFIVANLYFFVKEVQLEHLGLLDTFIFQHGLIPARFFNDIPSGLVTIFSSMFLHGGWAHVLGNMWFLFIFGDNVEDAMGHFRYFFYYLLMGIGAAAAQLGASPASSLPMVGASGAVAGILGSYYVLYPGARIETLFILVIFPLRVEISAFFYLVYWFLIQALNGFGALSETAIRAEMGGVAWMAHVGGFLSGIIAIFIFRRRRR